MDRTQTPVSQIPGQVEAFDSQLEPEPEPEPELGLQPSAVEPEPERHLSRAADFLDRNTKTVNRLVSSGEEDIWRHGEVLFEDTGTVTKFLIVPDHVKDPEDVLRMMLDDWNSEYIPATSVHTYFIC
jgi:hypothetical protein|eukprot:COSAG02_NODE_2753_length_8093_cov_4.161746_4_plen_127_part_00